MDDLIRGIIGKINDGVRIVIVKGAAGTGKTTLIRSLVPALKSIGFMPALMAPTGRAAMVLGKRTGCQSRTIHSRIYNCEPVVDNNNHGEALKFKFPLRHGYGHDIEDTAFIVDEASMVGLSRHDNDRELFQFGSGSLLLDLLEHVGLNVPDTTNILFFVGDPYQLPPVMENISMPPALDERKIAELTGCDPFVVELKDVHRQTASSGILEEATKLRQCLENKEFNYCRFACHDDLTIEDADGFLDSLQPEQNLDEKIVIAHTNAWVKELNNLVRRRLNIDSVRPVQGERLLVVRNARHATRDGSINQFYNGEFIKVEREYGEECRLDGFYTPKDEHKTYHYTFTWRKMDVSWIYDPEHGICHGLWVNVSPIVSREWERDEQYAPIALYNGVKRHIEEKLREAGIYSVEEVAARLKHSVLLKAPVVKFGYAVTGHKSQGGEWSEAWVDYTFGPAVHSEFFFRWAYTATTRAKKHLHALYPPAIDSLANVFRTGTTAIAATDVQQQHMPTACGRSMGGTMQTFFDANGMSVSEIQSMSNRYRVVVKDIATQLPKGYVDFIYRRNGLVSSIEARMGNTVLDLAEVIRLSVGQSVDAVLGRSNDAEQPQAGCAPVLVGYMQSIVERITSACEGSGIGLKDAKALTPYQLRLSFSSSHGCGMLDLYFNRKGRLTSLGENTLPQADYAAIAEAIGKEPT